MQPTIPVVTPEQQKANYAAQNDTTTAPAKVGGSASTITSEQMKGITPVPLVTPMYNTNGVVLQGNQAGADIINQANIAEQNYQAKLAENKKGYSEYANMQTLLGGKGQATLDAYNQKDTSGESLNDIYKQISGYKARAENLDLDKSKAYLQTQQESIGTGRTDAGIAPLDAAKQRAIAIEKLSLAQDTNIAMAKYDAAKNYADQLVNAKYDQIEADITAKLTNLQALKDFDLTPAQTKAADARTRALEYQKDVELEKKAVQLKNNELLINAASIGAPSDVQSKAKAIADKGGSSVEVASALGSWASNYYQNEALKMELTAKKLEELKTKGLGVAPIGSITKDVGVTTDAFMKGIAGTESAGSTDAYGGTDPYKVLSGQLTISDFNAMSQKEKDNTAYGKYQVMGFNIPKWTSEAFGKAMTIQEFLNSPEKQDALMRYRAEQEYAKYGNWDDVASIWFSGKPASGNTRSDKFGTSVPTYISKYRDKLGFSTGNQSVPEGAITFNGKIVPLTKLQQAQFTDINNEINSAVKSDIGVISSYKNIEQTATLAKQGNPASQISLVFSYMKALDPTSTVREGEFATVQNAAGVPEQIRNQYNKVMSGNFLTSGQIDNIVAEAKGRADISQGNINSVLIGVEARAATFGLPKGLVSETIKTRLNSNTQVPKTPEDSLVDDIYKMQQKVESTTPKYIIF